MGVVGRDGTIPVLGVLLVGVEERDKGLDPGTDADAKEDEEEGFLPLMVEKIGPLLVDLAAAFHPLFLCKNEDESLILVVMRSGFELAACCCKKVCFRLQMRLREGQKVLHKHTYTSTNIHSAECNTQLGHPCVV